MVFALLISAIIWNLGTWYLGLPASSSHALIGSIMGVGLANSLLSPGHVFGEGVNWAKASEVGSSLLISPLVGFVCAALLCCWSQVLIRRARTCMRRRKRTRPPPLWIRGLLILTCTGVSFGHGSNDGQKGMGLIMLILVGILPTTFAVDLGTGQAPIKDLAATTETISGQMDQLAPGVAMAGYPGSRRRVVRLSEDHRQRHAANVRGDRHQVPRDQRADSRASRACRSLRRISGACCAATCTSLRSR